MASALTVLLLGCWLARQSGTWGWQYPQPTISVSPSRIVALGGSVTIRCGGLYPGMKIFLRKAGHPNLQARSVPDGTVAEFPIASVSREDGGNYTCEYQPIREQNRWSYFSYPVEIIVAEPSYPKPNISLSPSEGVSLGGAVTIRCRGQHQGMWFVLNKEGRHFQTVDSDRFEVVFPISNVCPEHGGSYSCSYHSRSEPFAVSYPSDPVELVVRDPSLPRPSISLSPTGVTAPGADVTIRCQGRRWDVRFFLHKAGDLNPQQHVDLAGDGAEFRIPTVDRQHGGNYSCSYRLRSEPFVSSQPSDTVQLVVAGGTNQNQSGAAPAPTRPGSTGSDGSESPAPLGLTSPIIAGVSVVAAVLLLLFVAFICFRKTRARKGAAPRPSSTSPMVALKAPAQEDPTYASIDEGKEPQTLPQEPDPGADGLTYAELDGQALQAKRGGLAPAPEPAQPSVYATINVSQGPHSESTRSHGALASRGQQTHPPATPAPRTLLPGKI